MLFDPLDGSSNIDVNGTLGTIFSVRRRRDGSVADLLRSGREQVAAGYILYGPSVLLVYTTGAETAPTSSRSTRRSASSCCRAVRSACPTGAAAMP